MITAATVTLPAAGAALVSARAGLSVAHMWVGMSLAACVAIQVVVGVAVRGWLRSDSPPPSYWGNVRKAHNIVGYMMVRHGAGAGSALHSVHGHCFAPCTPCQPQPSVSPTRPSPPLHSRACVPARFASISPFYVSSPVQVLAGMVNSFLGAEMLLKGYGRWILLAWLVGLIVTFVIMSALDEFNKDAFSESQSHTGVRRNGPNSMSR